MESLVLKNKERGGSVPIACIIVICLRADSLQGVYLAAILNISAYISQTHPEIHIYVYVNIYARTHHKDSNNLLSLMSIPGDT